MNCVITNGSSRVVHYQKRLLHRGDMVAVDLRAIESRFEVAASRKLIAASAGKGKVNKRRNERGRRKEARNDGEAGADEACRRRGCFSFSRREREKGNGR